MAYFILFFFKCRDKVVAYILLRQYYLLECIEFEIHKTCDSWTLLESCLELVSKE